MNQFVYRIPATALSLLAGATAFAQSSSEDELKTVRVIRIDSPPVIDGSLDDAVWERAEVITDFHQTRPGDGAQPSEPTELYLLYDEDAFYIGARMYDSNPELIAAPTFRHGQGLGSDDRLVVILDPFNTRRAGYRFETNANGIRHDALYQDITSFQSDWTAIWDTAASITDEGWIAELEIPFKTLPFDPNIDTWGFNFGRGIRRRGEEMAWVSRNRSYNPSIVGLAEGLSGMDQGKGLDIVPSVAVTQARLFDPGSSDSNMEPSLDVFYRLTPSLNAALTINTDFSSTEVDNRQVNLTRFSLFFPEKRDFFLNDADLFQFGRIGGGGNGNNQASSRADRENARPYFSRRIGLDQTGAPVDLEYGGRVSGRLGRWSIGTLAIRQDEAGDVDATDLFVGRISADISQESTFGIILTDGDPRSNLDNSVYGFDYRYLNTRLPGGRQLEADVWLQRSETEGIDGDDGAFGVAVRMPNNTGLRGGISLKEVEQNFNPAMGFVDRSNIQDLSAEIGFTRFFESSLMQSAYFGIDAQRIESLEGQLETEIFKFRLLEIETNSRDEFQFGHTANEEVVLDAFTIYEDSTRIVEVPAGRYSFGQTDISFETAGQRRFSGGLGYETGDFFGGSIDTISSEFSWNRSNNFTMTVEYEYNDVELPQGDFISRLVSVSSAYAFSPNLYWINLIQYDNVSEEFGINTRLQWIPKAGQEGFVVLNHNLQDFDKDNTFKSASSDLSVKFKYTFRF
ncbi:MAG TPA: carbohydrate binding family 9 domain-containing protein [Gammaproteobacteria bacterium]|nr:carbohydrate binding family 9 domain-containing protein [Gammaproteobacteria bacterium]